VVKQFLARQNTVLLIAKEVSGQIVPTIMKEIHSNTPPAATSTPPSLSDEEVAMKVFELLEAGSSFVDVMGEHKLDESTMTDLMERYGKLKSAEAKASIIGERYLEGWFKLAKYMGEVKRDECDQFNDETGEIIHVKYYVDNVRLSQMGLLRWLSLVSP